MLKLEKRQQKYIETKRCTWRDKEKVRGDEERDGKRETSARIQRDKKRQKQKETKKKKNDISNLTQEGSK